MPAAVLIFADEGPAEAIEMLADHVVLLGRPIGCADFLDSATAKRGDEGREHRLLDLSPQHPALISQSLTSAWAPPVRQAITPIIPISPKLSLNLAWIVTNDGSASISATCCSV